MSTSKQARELVQSQLGSVSGPQVLDPKFAERLASFANSPWLKPRKLNPIILSRHGWSKLDDRKLTCASCRAQLIIPEISSDSHDQKSLLVEKTLELLQHAHKDVCHFAKFSCHSKYSSVFTSL